MFETPGLPDTEATDTLARSESEDLMPSPKGSTRRPASAEASSAMPPPDEAAVSGDYVSPSMEVLEQLEMQNALSTLEARLDSMEIDVARLAGMRDDDGRRVEGEMAVMKARVEDALRAFAGTADELRTITRDVERRLEEVVARELGERDATPALREELRAGIDGVMAGVGDVLESMSSDMRHRIEMLGSQMRIVQDAMIRIAEHVGSLAPLADRLAALEERAERRVTIDD